MKNIDFWIKRMEKRAEAQELPLQDNIEMQMREVVNLGSFDAVYLYDKEGLLIAECNGGIKDNEYQLIQISLMVNKVKGFVHELTNLSDLKEIILEDSDGRKIIYRFLSFFNQPTILVAVVPTRKAYRGLTNRLQRSIAKLSLIEK